MQWRPRPNHTTIWVPKPGGMFSTGMRARHAATPVKRASCSPNSSERTVERSPSAPMSRSPSSEWPSSKCAVTPSGRLVEPDEPGAQPHALLRDLAHERREQVGAVQADVLLAVVLLLRAVAVDEQPAAVVHAAPLGRVDRDAGGPHELRGAQVAHRLHGVRREAQPGPDLGELGRALEHSRVETRALQGDGGGHPADASSRDEHPHAPPQVTFSTLMGESNPA